MKGSTASGAESPAERIVALAASAGGVDALARVIGHLPADFPAHVLALLHQAPDRSSQLVEILARVATLPVAIAADHSPLPGGRISVVPPGQHALIVPGPRMRLIASGPSPPNRPSADLLFATLATAVGPRAIGVVLTGGGHDGATGATAIHACGGTVVATDQASSLNYAMPSATIARDGVIDYIVDLDAVGPLLGELVGAPAPVDAR
jgi:two-component system chemotaxis response regulator CheB